MKDHQGTLVTVISADPAVLLPLIEDGLHGSALVSVRALSAVYIGRETPRPGEVLVIDFTTLEDADLGHAVASWVDGHPCLALVAEHTERREMRGLCGERLVWPGQADELAACLRRLIEQASRPPRLEQALTLRLNMIGESPAFRAAMGQVEKFSRCDAPVMILGETGTGKEKVARAIHYLGLAEGTPFVAVNCGALPDSLVENELFGHVKGAYTDARQAQRGLVEQAAGGTLFLDEIEALSNKGQIALLRFLQEYEYRPLGSDTLRQARLRLITASNEPLESLVKQGLFRKDLYYRINILSLSLPPLRERTGDATLLAEHFLQKYRERYAQPDRYLAADTLEWMARHDWPGNVRELENLILREFLLAEGACIRIEAPQGDTTAERRRAVHDRRYQRLFQQCFQDAKEQVVSSFEQSYLRHTLQAAGGNVSQAARLAGKERRTFSKLLDKYGLSRKQFR